MTKYRIELNATADVKAYVVIIAKSLEEATAQAIEEAKAGNVEWKCNGAQDGTVEVV